MTLALMFVCGMFVGAMATVVVLSCCIVAGDCDRRMEGLTSGKGGSNVL